MSIVWKVRGVSVSVLLVVFSYVIEMNIIDGPFLGYWLSGVRCRAAGCQYRKRDAARLALSSCIGRVNGQLEQRVRVVSVLFRNELPFLVESLDVKFFVGG